MQRHILNLAAVAAAALLCGQACAQTAPVPQGARPAAPAATTASATPLPGGAGSISETYSDWRVTCAQQEKTKRCAVSQYLARKEDGTRVLGIEVLPPSAGKTMGALILPFGLSLDGGVVVQVEGRAALAPLRYKTCAPVGCLVPLNLDAATLASMRSATALNVKAVAGDDGREVPFSISLKGFGTALDRAAALAR